MGVKTLRVVVGVIFILVFYRGGGNWFFFSVKGEGIGFFDIVRLIFIIKRQGTFMADRKDSVYFMYFPGNYRWSVGFINMLSSAPYGGSEIGELYKIGCLLKDKVLEDDVVWFDACVKVVDGVCGHVEKFD